MTDAVEFRSRRVKRPETQPPAEPLPLSWRMEDARLERLGYRFPHTAQSDYELVRAVSMGEKITRYAVTTEISISELMNRWKALVGPLRTEDGHRPLEAQERLLKVLRHRAPVVE